MHSLRRLLDLFIAIMLFILFALSLADTASFIGSGFDAKTGQYVGTVFDSPNQAIHSDESVVGSVYNGIYESYTEYLHKYSESYEFDIGLKFGPFGAGYSHQKVLAYVYDQINSEQRILTHGYYAWTYESAVLYPPYVLKLNPMFAKITNLDELVRAFGTHYVDRGTFGGRLDFFVGVDRLFASKYSATYVAEQYGLFFHSKLFDIDSGGFKNRSDIHVDKAFAENIQSKTFFDGGDPALTQNLSQWVQSIADNTFPLNVSLVGIWNLFDDPIKRGEVKAYVSTYLNGYGESNSCLGSGIDLTTMELSCLNQVYEPTDVFRASVPESQLVEFSVVMKESFNIDAYFHEKTESHGFLGFGSKSKETWRFYQNYFSENKSLTKIVLTLVFEKVTAPALPMPQLNQLFLLSVDKLPTYSNQTARIYEEFIAAWGTAVIDEVVTGGEFETNIWYDSSFNSVYTEERISQSAHWSFAGIIGNGHGSTSDTYFVDKEFNQTMAMSYAYVGGNITMSPSEYLDWASTVQGSQQVIKYHTVPITYFVMDPTKKRDIGSAIEAYGRRSMDELDAYVKSFHP